MCVYVCVSLYHRIDEVKFMQFTEVENHDDFYKFLPTPEAGQGVVRVWDPQGANIVYDVALEDLRVLERELLIVGSYYIERGCGLGEGSDTRVSRGFISGQLTGHLTVL